MKIAVAIYRENEGTPFRKFGIKPNTENDLDGAIDDISTFISECYEEIEDEGEC